MSSNIEIQRICAYCGDEFTARTTVTKLCSPKCRKLSYRARQRAEKVQGSNRETERIKNKPVLELKQKEFLSVRDVASLLGCSIRTAYRLIDNGTLKGVNLAERLTRVKRSELDRLLEQPKPRKPEPIEYAISECYTITETLAEFGISDKALFEVIKRNEIPRIRKGKYTYIPKVLISRILS